MASSQTTWILIAIVAVIIVGMFVQRSYDIFSTVLPEGQTHSNTDCSFITNAQFSSDYPSCQGCTENIDNYGGLGNWIAVDFNKDGIKEGYGFYGSTGSNRDPCSGKEIITYTPSGMKVVKYEIGSNYNEVAICSGLYAERFRNTDPDAAKAVLTCSSTSNPADTDHNGKVDRTELGIFITKWINNQASRDDLGKAISAWVSG